MKEHALELAGLGLRVFPCHYPISRNGDHPACSCGHADCASIGKHPVSAGWQEAATSEAAAIRKEWRTHPTCNVGIVTGHLADVLDVDGEHGVVSLTGLEVEHGKLPDTWRVRTGSGGLHYYFKSSGKLKNRTRFAPGLDVRAAGGFVVGPGSVHASGGVYQWEPDFTPQDCELADMPEWLAQEIIGAQPTEGNPVSVPEGGWTPPPAPYDEPRHWLEHYLVKVEQGTRNVTGFRLAEQLCDNVLAFDPARERELVQVMREFAERCPGDGYSSREAEKSLYSALNHRRANGFREPAGPGEQITGFASRKEKSPTPDQVRGEPPPQPVVEWFESLAERNTQWIRPGLIARQGITVLAGEPGAGKTTLAAELTYHLATGSDHWGERVQWGRVLWLGFDDPPERIRSEKLELLGDIPAETVCTLAEPLPLTTVTLAAYADIIRKTGVTLIVADTMLDWLELPDYDKTGPARAAMALVRTLVEQTGVAVLGICHVSKDVTRLGVARIANSTQLTAKCDVAALLLNDYSDSDLCKLHVVKNRLGPSGWRVTLIKESGRFVPQEDNRPRTTTEIIYDSIAECGRISRKDLLHKFDGQFSVRAVERAVKRLMGEGMITTEYIGENHAAVYCIPNNRKRVSEVSEPSQRGVGTPVGTGVGSVGTVGTGSDTGSDTHHEGSDTGSDTSHEGSDGSDTENQYRKGSCANCGQPVTLHPYDEPNEGRHWYECAACDDCRTVQITPEGS